MRSGSAAFCAVLIGCCAEVAGAEMSEEEVHAWNRRRDEGVVHLNFGQYSCSNVFTTSSVSIEADPVCQKAYSQVHEISVTALEA